MSARSKRKVNVTGTVTKALPGTQFKVVLENGHEVLAYPCGKIRQYFIRIVLGDRVDVELSLYDLRQGRIVYRHTQGTVRGSMKDLLV